MSLQLQLDRPLPDSLPTGSSTAVFIVGSCFHASQRIERLEVVFDGNVHPTAAHGLPRPDVAAEHGPSGFFSGFWVTLPLPARDQPGRAEVVVRAALGSGEWGEASLGTMAFGTAEAPASVEVAERPGAIAVCMATFEPDEGLFRAQVGSLRAQSDDNWICLISDDGSAPERFERIVDVVGDDSRFAIARSARRLGPYRNFERALELVPQGVELIALSDQDDRWHPDKLATLRAAIGDALLAYSDMRLVEADGRVLRETMWRRRSNNHVDLVSMLVANTITGAATLFRRELLELALPFPDTPGFQFHDHWLAVMALAAGRVAYVDRPLYDYVQHPGAVFGDVTHGGPTPRVPARRLARRRAAYFYGYVSRQAQAEVVLARRAEGLSPEKRRALERFVACDSSLPALLWLACRPLRLLLGRTETLGTEVELVLGIGWKRLIMLRARRWRHRRGPLSDASVPPPESFSQKRLRRWRARIED